MTPVYLIPMTVLSNGGLVWIALLMGLAGSAHCIGMCGGLAVLAGSGVVGTSKARLNLIAWHSGKTVTYAAMGGLLGALGEAVPTSFTGLQGVVVIFTAALLIMTGWHMTGFGPSWSLVAPSPVSSFVARMASLVRTSSTGGRFALGLLNGLLPCGLVYAALGFSLTYQSALRGAAFMALFGIGTAPVLLLIGLGTGFFNQRSRVVVTKTVGWIVILAGVYTITRFPGLMHTMH